MEHRCTHCGGEMKPGYLIDLVHRGPVEEIGEKVEWIESQSHEECLTTECLKVGQRRRLEVVTFCCTQCGFLESFAQQAVGSTTSDLDGV
jgi:hypothetical protein